HGKEVNAKGNINLNKNDLLIKPIDSKLTELTGQIKFNNGDLVGDKLKAQWLGQPVDVNFSTVDNPKDYQVKVDLGGNWDIAK
ncbi:YhdP family protein, partial [Vibrio parahaemolyticus]|uniref:YhdP family protein n=1 Tax=Vibrio parahaemolyticus TaxID=670 RepID=UPI001A8F88A3